MLSRRVSEGFRIYWSGRIAPHRALFLGISLAFVLAEILLLSIRAPLFALTVVVAGVAALAGDIASQIQVAQCPSCGALVNPAPAYRRACPLCEKTIGA